LYQEARGIGSLFRIARSRVAPGATPLSRVKQNERDRIRRMGLGYNGSAMIGHQKDAPPGELFEPRQYGPDDLFVEILYSLDLQIQLAGMRSFVRSFDVDKYEIFLLERIQGA